MPPISDQSVLILGGSSGIGFDAAKLCLANGVRVAIASSSATEVNSALERLIQAFPDSKDILKGCIIDLNSDDVETELERILADVTKHGAQPLDHIINTAGRSDVHPLEEIDLLSLFESTQVPLFVPVLLGKLAPKYLRVGCSSSLIFTSGQIAEEPLPGQSILAAYAAGVHGLTRSLACDLAPRRVNCVATGSTETELWVGGANMRRQVAVPKSFIGKPASSEEIAEAVLYLMRNTDATGSVLIGNAGSVLE